MHPLRRDEIREGENGAVPYVVCAVARALHSAIDTMALRASLAALTAAWQLGGALAQCMLLAVGRWHMHSRASSHRHHLTVCKHLCAGQRASRASGPSAGVELCTAWSDDRQCNPGA